MTIGQTALGAFSLGDTGGTVPEPFSVEFSAKATVVLEAELGTGVRVTRPTEWESETGLTNIWTPEQKVQVR